MLSALITQSKDMVGSIPTPATNYINAPQATVDGLLPFKETIREGSTPSGRTILLLVSNREWKSR
jgi:hypothetical protein